MKRILPFVLVAVIAVAGFGPYAFALIRNPVSVAPTLTIGTSTLVVANNKVGIGTTSPFTTLGVAGSGWFSGNCFHVGDTVNTVAGGVCSNFADTGLELVGNDNTTAGVTALLQNTNPGVAAYTDIYFANNNPNGFNNYVALNLNSSNYTSITYGTALAVANQFSMQNTFGPVMIAATATTSAAAAYINFVTGGTDASNEAMRINAGGFVGIGTTTPIANFQVTATSTNATTSVQFGKAGQNKGTCITYYDTAGTPVYGFIAGGATVFTFTTTKPSGCQN